VIPCGIAAGSLEQLLSPRAWQEEQKHPSLAHLTFLNVNFLFLCFSSQKDFFFVLLTTLLPHSVSSEGKADLIVVCIRSLGIH
jgi:hypothetical protein